MSTHGANEQRHRPLTKTVSPNRRAPFCECLWGADIRSATQPHQNVRYFTKTPHRIGNNKAVANAFNPIASPENAPAVSFS